MDEKRKFTYIDGVKYLKVLRKLIDNPKYCELWDFKDALDKTINLLTDCYIKDENGNFIELPCILERDDGYLVCYRSDRDGIGGFHCKTRIEAENRLKWIKERRCY